MKIHPKLRKPFLLIVGVFFILVGIAGLFLPVIQGILSIIIGVLFLSMWSPRIRTWLDERTVHYPKLHPVIKRAEAWIEKFMG